MWKDISGYEGLYQVSHAGEVRRLAVPITKAHNAGALCRTPPLHLLKWIPDCSKGYVRVRLFKQGVWRTFRIHRLVAGAFLENPTRKREVNHKDGNKLNNHVGNLEWVTSSENFKHALKNGFITLARGKRHGNARAIIQYTLAGKRIRQFDTIRQALDALHVTSNCLILKHLRGEARTAYGSIWKYVEVQ